MNKKLNKIIIGCSVLLILLVVGHLEKNTYYTLAGSEARFPRVKTSQPKIYLSIYPVDSTLKYETEFIPGKSSIRLDTLIILVSCDGKNLRIEGSNDLPPLNPDREKVRFRSVTKIFDLRDCNVEKLNSNFRLVYTVDDSIKRIHFNTALIKKSTYSINSWDMHDPTMLLIPLLKYGLLLALISQFIIYRIKKSKSNS
jgi:hypothetical protein